MNYASLDRMPAGQALIYRIVNKENGKMYVGSTTTPRRRFWQHSNQLQNNGHHSFILQKAFDVYGASAFAQEPLLVCAEKDRDFYENIYIKAADYNVAKEAGPPRAPSRKGKKHTRATKETMREAARARWAKERQTTYAPLCEEAWNLYLNGEPRYKACKRAGISHSTFWDWLKQNEVRVKKEDAKGRKMFRHSVEASNRAKHRRVFCPELQCVFFSRKDAAAYFCVGVSYVSEILLRHKGRKIQRKYSLQEFAP